MFVNEYVMTRKRYDKWAAPKFWRLPIFYVYCVIFASGTFGWIYFHHVGASLRWQSVGATLSFIAIYRGVFFKWMHADKTFRVMRTQYFNDKDWTCKVMIREKDIALYINNKINNHVNWEDLPNSKRRKLITSSLPKTRLKALCLTKSLSPKATPKVSNNGC